MKLQKELATADLLQLVEDLRATGWNILPVAGGALGSALLCELTHGENIMHLVVGRDGGGEVFYELSEGPVVRDSMVG